MNKYEKMWKSLKTDIKIRMREYQNAGFVTNLDEFAETELDTWEGIIQEMDGLEREYEEER